MLLTILVGDSIESCRSADDPEYYGDIVTALVRILEDLNDYLQSNATMPSIYDPASTGRDFRERWDQDGYSNFRAGILGSSRFTVR
ncbi:hypothetical protein ACYB2S_08515 [Corynebacterium variabile]|uniref:hypothetical protein n=1 Tax=Corynebacterium variabile TaxID=1727 RepID=UPI003CAFCA45